MAHMQLEVEKQMRKKSPIAEMVSTLAGRVTLSIPLVPAEGLIAVTQHVYRWGSVRLPLLSFTMRPDGMAK